ncbi:5-formyltetrahydrofolate cyclo-ligase [Pelagibacterales bacterium SAG-MED09]|nr:5-formyltetrahydrofolate cyclo-ligase [Pelagibacterales bacterium SAG-MED09]
MNSIIEKEKKLSSALERLRNLNLQNPELDKSVMELSNKKNQLEIEKIELEDKYKLLKEDYDILSKKIDEINNKEKLEEIKQIEFSEKIDELNQETDTLLEEIDKWQT